MRVRGFFLAATIALAFGVATTSAIAAPMRTGRTSPLLVGRSEVPGSIDERGQAALQRVRFDWKAALPGWQVVFLPPRKGYLGLTLRRQKRIEIYVRSDRALAAIAHDVAHELGHAIDVTYNDEFTRARYLELRRLAANTPWWTCNGCTDLDVGAGDFAETFAAWATPSSLFYSRVQGAPSASQLSAIAADVYPTPVTQTAHAAA